MDWGLVFFFAFFFAFSAILIVAVRRGQSTRPKKSKKVTRRGAGNKAARRAEGASAKARARDEALFVSMFPELQPHFHPEALVQYVRAERARRGDYGGGGFTWKRPPGLGVAAVEILPGVERVVHILRDSANAQLATFQYDDHPEGGVLRVGKGKLTVNVKDAVPRVRYWHPEREFKWSEAKGWTFVTPIADPHTASSIDSRDTSYSSSSSFRDRSDSGPSVPVGGGGTFDGGGASASWDDSASSASGGGSSESGASTSY